MIGSGSGEGEGECGVVGCRGQGGGGEEGGYPCHGDGLFLWSGNNKDYHTTTHGKGRKEKNEKIQNLFLHLSCFVVQIFLKLCGVRACDNLIVVIMRTAQKIKLHANLQISHSEKGGSEDGETHTLYSLHNSIAWYGMVVGN